MKENNIIHSYACCNKDDEVRMKSSSGGIFTLLAEYVLSNNGYVSGAAFEDNLDLRHIIISDAKDLEKLRGSKYVRSNIGNVFNEIKELLDNEKPVLFCGTPCQVEGLNKFLKKEYSNLITVDIICHGTVRRDIFDRYKTENNIKNINFRDKSRGWRNYGVNTDSSYQPFRENVYMQGFLKDLTLYDSCYSCNSRMPRPADITLGDCWGIHKFNKKLNDDKGLSLVLINSEKGIDTFNSIRPNLSICEEFPLELAFKRNPSLIYSAKPHPKRDLFFKELKENNIESINELINKYTQKPVRKRKFKLVKSFIKELWKKRK